MTKPIELYIKSLTAPKPQTARILPVPRNDRFSRVGVRLVTLTRRPTAPAAGFSIRLYRA
ncbi:hypothetical protein LLG95_05570 [bacterium]|nr:hypothetical protein [bacterium]